MPYRIGIMGDTHAYYASAQQAVKQMGDVDVLIHVGDYIRDAQRLSREFQREIICVQGNCDPMADEPLTRLIELGGWKLFIAHGHQYSVKFSLERFTMAVKEAGAQIGIYGHTHMPQVSFDEGIYFISPGSTGEPRGSGPTFALLHLTDDKVIPQIVRIDERR